MVAEVSPSTTSVHLDRLRAARLVKVLAEGKHRFYSLAGSDVARALEALSVLAGGSGHKFVPRTPSRLRVARTCYDHMAGALGVLLHDRFNALGWLSAGSRDGDRAYDLTLDGTTALERLGIEVEVARKRRRRFACACLDWSERRPHLGGARCCRANGRTKKKMGDPGSGLQSLGRHKPWTTRNADPIRPSDLKHVSTPD